jgi:hypothetical protein
MHPVKGTTICKPHKIVYEIKDTCNMENKFICAAEDLPIFLSSSYKEEA